MRKVTLLLSDGTQFHGESFGYEAPVAGEVVFNTAMMGYPESLTDPSYAGQLMDFRGKRECVQRLQHKCRGHQDHWRGKDHRILVD